MALAASVLAHAAPAAATVASAAAVGGAPSYRHGAEPTVHAARAHAARAQASGAVARWYQLRYGGGNNGVGVTTGAPQVYLVFWGWQWGSSTTDANGYLALSGDPGGMAPDLQAFLKGLGTNGETWSGVVTQYCQEVAAGAQSCPANAAHVGFPVGGALAGVWADTATAAPASADAHQLAAEAVNAAQHFGNTSQPANRNAQYFVVSPTGTTPDGFNTTSGEFCAWHDWSGDPALPGGGAVLAPVAVAFTNLPYVTDAGSNCGMQFVNTGAAGTLDGVTLVAGHEYAETLSDQFPVGGWVENFYGPAYSGDEVADKCAWLGGGQGQVDAKDLALATGSFPVQSLWANDLVNGQANGYDGGCELSHPIIRNANTAPAITGANSYIFTVGVPGAMGFVSTGFPVPSLGESGLLPPGLAFVDNHDGTAMLAGTTATITLGGTYPVTVTATNGIGPAAVAAVTLTVNGTRGGTVVGFAGDPAGGPGWAGDGGPAIAAGLWFPTGVAVDAAGAVFISDSDNDRVRKVDPRGSISNVAGSPANFAGNTGDGGPATSAELYTPTGLAVDGAGNLYLADTGNNRIRKVDTAGVITDFAGNTAGAYGDTGDGGPATSATLSSPKGVAVDRAGNVYIADTGNNLIRMVDRSGIITTFAGLPQAPSPLGSGGYSGDGGPAAQAALNGPTAVALDAAGVYIADGGNDVVRKVDPRGVITTVAGNPSRTRGNTGDGGPATSAELNGPGAIALDRAGNLYLTDVGNNRVRMVDAGGTITNVAGNPAAAQGNAGDGGSAAAATFYNPVGVAVDEGGDVFVADEYNNRVRELLATSASITSASAATFTVGVPGSFQVTTGGYPSPNVTESGALPANVTFDGATASLTGMPAPGTAGSYPLTFTTANGAATAVQNFTLFVNQVALTYPADGQAGVDTTQPFTWSAIPQAQAYLLQVGTAPFGHDLVDSGVLPAAQSRYSGPALPAGPTLHATLYAEVNGAWTYQANAFTAAPGQATLTFPVDGQGNADPTRAFTWTTVAHAQSYLLLVGTTAFWANVVNSGILPPSQSSYATPILPAGRTLHATLYTEVNGGWSRYQTITFTTGPAMATFSHPVAGQIRVAAPTSFTWTTVALSQGYYLLVGTTAFGANVVNSGVMAPTRSSYGVSTLPPGRTLYATLYTEIKGAWTYQAITFTSASG